MYNPSFNKTINERINRNRLTNNLLYIELKKLLLFSILLKLKA